MKTSVHHRLAATLFVVALLVSPILRAQQPYVVLRQPKVHQGHHGVPTTPPAPTYETHAQAYAYGWFGAPPRQHWSRSFGYHRAYTQWTGR